MKGISQPMTVGRYIELLQAFRAPQEFISGTTFFSRTREAWYLNKKGEVTDQTGALIFVESTEKPVSTPLTTPTVTVAQSIKPTNLFNLISKASDPDDLQEDPNEEEPSGLGYIFIPEPDEDEDIED